MTTDSQNQIQTMLHLRHLPAVAAADDGAPLPAPPPLDPAARRALDSLSRIYPLVLPAVEARLEALQDDFIAQLSRKMQGRGLAPQGRLRLSPAAGNTVLVEGEEDEAAGLRALFEACPYLGDLFHEMARLAVLAHGMEVTSQAYTGEGNNLAAVVADNTALLGRYQMCLKGSLSHFYLR